MLNHGFAIQRCYINTQLDKAELAGSASQLARVPAFLRITADRTERFTLVQQALQEHGEELHAFPLWRALISENAAYTGWRDILNTTAAQKESYESWEQACEEGAFTSALESKADAFYERSRDIAARRLEIYNQMAEKQGLPTITKLSHSFIDLQTPGLNPDDVHALATEFNRQAGPVYKAVLEAQRASALLPAKDLKALTDGITADDKMELEHRLLNDHPGELGHVQVKTAKAPFCQGLYRQVVIGLNPDYSFFRFLKAARHENAHADYRGNLNPELEHTLEGDVAGAAGDETVALYAEYFDPVEESEAQIIIKHLQDIMGSRFPESFTAKHIMQGMSSLEPELLEDKHWGRDMDPVRYVPTLTTYSRAESRMIDGPYAMSRYPDIFAEEYFGATETILSTPDAERMLVERFQSFAELGRNTSYVPAMIAAGCIAEKLEGKTREEKRKWWVDNIYSAGASLTFPELMEKALGEPLSAGPLVRQCNKIATRPEWSPA